MSNVKTLLIVDDSQVSRQILRNRFGKARPDWKIYDSDNGADALELAAVILPDFVTMDVNMPNMSGLEAAEKLLSKRPGVRIVMVTANIQEATSQRAKDMGCGFIEKPITDQSIPSSLIHFEGPASHV